MPEVQNRVSNRSCSRRCLKKHVQIRASYVLSRPGAISAKVGGTCENGHKCSGIPKVSVRFALLLPCIQSTWDLQAELARNMEKLSQHQITLHCFSKQQFTRQALPLWVSATVKHRAASFYTFNARDTVARHSRISTALLVGITNPHHHQHTLATSYLLRVLVCHGGSHLVSVS